MKITPSKKRTFTDLWCAEYKKFFKFPYKFGGVIDGRAADRLLATGMEPEALVELAKQAWKHSRTTGDRFCWSKNSHSLCGFDKHFNNIQAEIGQREPPADPGAVNSF